MHLMIWRNLLLQFSSMLILWLNLIFKNIISINTQYALLIAPKLLTVYITTNCGKFFKSWEYQTILLASWETCIQVKKQQLELDMEQQTGSKSGKEYIKAVHCHPAYLTYMQNSSWEMLDWMKPKLGSRLPGEISITSDMQRLWHKGYHHYGRKWRGTEKPPDESEKGEWKI